jgi:hypothetical protein
LSRYRRNTIIRALSPKSVKQAHLRTVAKQRDIYYRSYREEILHNPTYYKRWVCVVDGQLIGPMMTKEGAFSTCEDFVTQFKVDGGYVTLVGDEAIVDTFQPEDLYV